MLITWTDSKDESEGEIDNKLMAFTRKYDSYNESSDEEMLAEELAETYRDLLTEWKET